MSELVEQSIFAIEAESEVMTRALELAQNSNAVDSTTGPRDRVSSSEALNSPFNAAELTAAIQVATIIFKGGAAAVSFLTALITLAREIKKTINVLNPSNGARIGTITATTTEIEIKGWLKK